MNKKRFTHWFCIFALCHLPVSYATDVYISIDENGNRIFSDVPNKTSRTHKIREISTIPAIKVPKTTATPIDSKQADSNYQQLSITNPSAESHISRDKLGSFLVSAQISPALNTTDEAVLMFDKQEISSGQQLRWQINSAERGAHSLQVIVRDKESKQEKISSKAISVYVKR